MKPINFTDEKLIEVISSSNSHKEAVLKLGYKHESASTYRKAIKRLKLDTSHFNKKDKKFSEDEFLSAIKSSKSHSEAMQKLGYKSRSGFVGQGGTRYNKLILKLNPDTTHFNLLSKSKSCPDSDIESLYNTYKNKSLKTRQLTFSISLEEFKNLVQQPCYYCNQKISNSYSKKKKPKYYCGLDRKNNNKGYEINNIVPCCKRCNFMKSNLSVDEFYNHITQIYNNTHK